jgi:uncharacterized protein
MKISALTAALAHAGLLATDAKPEAVAVELNKLLAADKKARDEAAEEKAAKDAAEAEEKAAKDAEKDDADANDEDVDADDELPDAPPGGAKKPAPTNIDKKGKDKAMDSKSVAALIAANDAKHAAAREVEPILGVVSYDSADKYYKAALDKLGVATDGVHASAFPALLKLAKDKATASAPIVGDAAAASDMVKAIPGLARLRK